MWAIEDQLEDEDFTTIEPEVERTLLRLGVQATAEERKKLAEALLLAQHEGLAAALKIHERTRETVTHGRVSMPRVPRGAPAETAVRIPDAVAQYRAERQQAWTTQTDREFVRVARMFCDFTGDVPLAFVTREHAVGFLGTIARLHPSYGRSIRGKELPLAELLEHHSGDLGLSPATLRRYTAVLRGLFEWARRRGLYHDDNPFVVK